MISIKIETAEGESLARWFDSHEAIKCHLDGIVMTIQAHELIKRSDLHKIEITIADQRGPAKAISQWNKERGWLPIIGS